MNCSNCGAPMKFVEDRNYFVCEHCTTFHFAKPDQDGVCVLDDQCRLICPRCRLPLTAATVEGQKALHCESCRGLLVTNTTFGHVVGVRRGRTDGPKSPPIPFDPAELNRALACPACQQRMDTHPYGGPGPVIVDTCPECSLIWLDHGELAKIERAPGSRW